MQAGFRNLFQPPAFKDPVKASRARSLHTVLLSTLALTFLFLIYAILFPPPGQVIIALIVVVIEFFLLLLVRSKRITVASVILTSMLWVAIVSEVALYGGIRDTGFTAFTAIIIIAGLTMGTSGSIIFTSLTLLAAGILAYAEARGLLAPYVRVSILSIFLSHGITLIAVAMLLNLAIRSISVVAHKAGELEIDEGGIQNLLQSSQAALEKHALMLEQRNATLETIASLSRISNQAKNESELLEQSAKILMDQLKMEFVAIYCLDQVEENAILQTSCGMESIPSPSIGDKLNVIRSDSASLLSGGNSLFFKVGGWNYYIDSPKILPDKSTNSVLPLTSNNKLLGLLNIQSSATAPQTAEKNAVQALADQIAFCLANIRLINQLKSSAQDASGLAGGAVQTAWEHLGSGGLIGYTYDRLQVIPTDEKLPLEIVYRLQQGKSVSFLSDDSPARARLLAPIILRENIIGVVGYDSSSVTHEWQEDEKVLLETVASRVSLALENTRLVAEAQQRAEREKLISKVSNKMRETLDIETILKTAVMEMRQSLELSEAEVRLQLSEQGNSTPEASHE